MIYNIELRKSIFTITENESEKILYRGVRSNESVLSYIVTIFNSNNEMIFKYRYKLFKFTKKIQIIFHNLNFKLNFGKNMFILNVNNDTIMIKNTFLSFDFPYKNAYKIYLNDTLYAKVKSKWTSYDYKIIFKNKNEYNQLTLIYMIMILTHTDSGA